MWQLKQTHEWEKQTEIVKKRTRWLFVQMVHVLGTKEKEKHSDYIFWSNAGEFLLLLLLLVPVYVFLVLLHVCGTFGESQVLKNCLQHNEKIVCVSWLVMKKWEAVAKEVVWRKIHHKTQDSLSLLAFIRSSFCGGWFLSKPFWSLSQMTLKRFFFKNEEGLKHGQFESYLRWRSNFLNEISAKPHRMKENTNRLQLSLKSFTWTKEVMKKVSEKLGLKVSCMEEDLSSSLLNRKTFKWYSKKDVSWIRDWKKTD